MIMCTNMPFISILFYFFHQCTISTFSFHFIHILSFPIYFFSPFLYSYSFIYNLFLIFYSLYTDTLKFINASFLESCTIMIHAGVKKKSPHGQITPRHWSRGNYSGNYAVVSHGVIF